MAALNIVPQAGQSLGATRDLISANFTSISTDFNVDHVDFGDSGAGKHAIVTFPQGSAPTVAADDCALYAKDQNSRPTMFFRQESDGTEIQMTGPDPVNAVNQANDGATFLPGGLLLQWGRISGAGTVTYAIAFSAQPHSIVVTPSTSLTTGTANIAATFGATTFTVQVSSGSPNVNWMAIGPI